MMRAVRSAVRAYHVSEDDRVRGDRSAKPAAARINGRTPHGPIGRNSSSTAVSRRISSTPTSVRQRLALNRNSDAANAPLGRSERLIGEFDLPHFNPNGSRVAALAQLACAHGFAKSCEKAIGGEELCANGREFEGLGDVELLRSF